MVIALIVACTLAGLFFGYAVHVLHELREAKFEISGYQQEELRLTDMIATLRAEVKAHETSLNMIMAEVNK